MSGWVRTAVAAMVLWSWAAPVDAQTADEIVERHLAALGGREALARIESRVSTGTITLNTALGPIAGTIEAYNKRPNRSRNLVKVNLAGLGAGEVTNDQRFDGTAGHVIDTLNGNRDITGAQLEAMRNNLFPTPLADYRSSGIALALAGRDAIRDRPAFMLDATPGTGPRVRMWIDADTYMVVKTAMTVDVPQLGTAVEQVTEFSDFRTVDGIQIPFVVTSTNPLQTVTAVLSDVRHNVPITTRCSKGRVPNEGGTDYLPVTLVLWLPTHSHLPSRLTNTSM